MAGSLAHPLRRAAAFILALILVGASLFVAREIYEAPGVRPKPNEYDVAAWEARNFLNRWLFAFGERFREAPVRVEEDATLNRFFQLTREIDALEQEVSDAAQRGLPVGDARTAALAGRVDERGRIENQVEATIESRVSQAIERTGLTSSLLFFDAVWPPVDFELTNAPRSLAVSPRDHIELKRSTLLRDNLSLSEVEAIEAETQRRENVSALAFPTGGVGAYPTIVDYPTSYRDALEVVAHEWMHNYLFFHPLGFNYYDNNELRTMNETVADLVGRELAEAVLAASPLTEPPAATPPPEPRPVVNLGFELRRLRGEVDVLLADGKVTEAEALMEQRRQELANRGVLIRKINQAYFAFTNLYAGAAGSPGATSPIGPKIDELRRRSGSLAAFVRVVRELTSVQELDRALAERQ